MPVRLLTALCLLYSVWLHAQTGKGPTKSPVVILQSQQHLLHSNVLGREMLVKVRLPEGYDTSNKNYPVLYLLDGDFFFAAATDIVQYLEWGNLMPEVIIVSPAYGSKQYSSKGGTNHRQQDFALTPYGTVKEAHPERFYNFLTKELVPFAERNFRTDSTNRCLWGYSSGSAFGSYVLFQEGQPFQRFILLEGYFQPAISYEKEYSKTHNDLPIKLFIGYGTLSKESKEVIESLQQRGYKNLSLSTMQLNNIEHFSIAGEGLTLGLKSVFKK